MLQIDWGNVDTNKLGKDSEFITLVTKYENALNGTGEYENSAAGYRQARMAECIDAIKELLYTHQMYLSVAETEEKQLKIAQCIVEGKDPVTYQNRLGINIDLHSQPGSSTISARSIYELSKSTPTSLSAVMSNDVILLGEGACDTLSGPNVDYIENNMKNKIVILSEVDSDSEGYAFTTPFKTKVESSDIAYSKVESAKFNLYMHEDAAQHVILYDDNMPVVAFMFRNEGIIMQWCMQPYVSAQYDTNTIDKVIYEIISAYLLNGTELEGTVMNLTNHIVQYYTSSKNDFPATKIYNSGSTSVTLKKNGVSKVVSGNYTTGNQKTHTVTSSITGAASNDDSLFVESVQHTITGMTGTLSRTGVVWTPQTISGRSTTQSRTIEATVFPATEEAIAARVEIQPEEYSISFVDEESGQTITMALELSESYDTAAMEDESCKITFHYSGTESLPDAPSGLYNGVATYTGILSSGEVDTRVWQQEYIGDISYDSANSAVVTYKEKKSADSFLDKIYYNQDGYEGWLYKDGSAVQTYESADYTDEKVTDWVSDGNSLASSMKVKKSDGTEIEYSLMHVEETLKSGTYDPGSVEIFSTPMYRFYKTKYEAEQAVAKGLPSTTITEDGEEYVIRYEATGNPVEYDSLFSYLVYQNTVKTYCNSYEEAANSTYVLRGSEDTNQTAYKTLYPCEIYSYWSGNTRKYVAVFDVAAANWNTSWQVTFQRTKSKAAADSRVYAYRGHYEYTADKITEWEQNYKGTVKKLAYSNSFCRGLEIVQDKNIDSYDIETQTVKLQTARRHVVRLGEVRGYSHKYDKACSMQSVNIMDLVENPSSVKSIALYCDEFYPGVIDNVISYSIVINGKSYDIIPINSKRNGIKIIRNTNFADNSSYVTYINETINTMLLTVKFKLTDERMSPFISNLKILIK